jgi:phosphinothricin acetyltransferase
VTRLRLAEPRDAPQLAEIYGPIVASTPISFEVVPPSAQEMERRIAASLSYAPWLVAVEGERVLGYAYACRHRDRAAYRFCVDVSVYVREGCRRAGLARALYASLFALLRLQGFLAAHAGIALPNPASVGLHEALGFRPVGLYPRVGFKLGAWHDVGWWQLELAERSGEPAEPLAMEELRRSPDFGRALATAAASASGPAVPTPAPPSAAPTMRIRRLEALDDPGLLRGLADLLCDAVQGGASVSFLWPLSPERALGYWREVAAGVDRGERALLLAEDAAGAVVGAVQLVVAQPENQPHRADLCKMLVHSRARRRGLGAALMRAAEELGRALGKRLLVLDTAAGSDAERLYQRLGWQPAGRIPDYALLPHGLPCATSILFKRLG